MCLASAMATSSISCPCLSWAGAPGGLPSPGLSLLSCVCFSPKLPMAGLLREEVGRKGFGIGDDKKDS